MLGPLIRILISVSILTFTVIVATTRATPNSPEFPVPSRFNLRYIDQIEKGSFVLEQMSLADLIEDPKIDGLSFDQLSESEMAALGHQADQYILFANKKMRSGKKAKYVTHCLLESKLDPFCEYLVKDGSWIQIRTKAKSSGAKRKDTAKAFREGKLDYLNGLTRRDLFRGLRKIQKWEEVKSIYLKSIKESRCRNTDFYTALGVKSEEFFPEKENIIATKELFQKNIDCYLNSNVAKTDHFKKILFRNALFNISDHNCKAIQPHLEILGNEKSGDFVTRALYWNAYCAAENGEKQRFEILKSRLLKANPLGYHNLSIQKGRIFHITQMIDQNPSPTLRFRTGQSNKLNWHVRVIEMLLRKDEKNLAKRILYKQRISFFQTENAFQIYIAYLSNRASNPILSFQLLSRLYRIDPTLISKDTLEIFYPVKYFTDLWKYRYRLDPYLTAALIRQESGFQADARSPAGALGLMQLMPYTARNMARVSRRQILKPRINIKLGIRYLKGLLKRFDGDAELALAGYNAGPHNVSKWLKRYPKENRMLFLDMIPFAETRNYVSLIARNYFWYTTLYSSDKTSLLVKKGRNLASERGLVRFPSLKAIKIKEH